MKIGELAALAGVSTRTVRHYHRIGLLPEPERLTNGYRDYRLRDAIALARVRRLAELGLSLDEIRDVLADDRGRDLEEVLAELDADLARQQMVIADRRARLAALLADPAGLHPDATVSPGVAEVLRGFPAGESALADLDRELLALLDTAVTPEGHERLLGLMRPLTEPAAAARWRAVYERLDELAEADLGDPRVAEVAADVAACIPGEAAAMAAAMGDLASTEAERWLRTLYAEVSPAQAEVFRRAVVMIARESEEKPVEGR
ncbi:MerR family transcriptional regulator [Streptosporangium sandarakinum]|uniref:MerR family transcriptional regulator n=1 Tax=Streptosporangium TaxID=2000 RepID=UPI0031F86834